MRPGPTPPARGAPDAPLTGGYRAAPASTSSIILSWASGKAGRTEGGGGGGGGGWDVKGKWWWW